MKVKQKQIATEAAAFHLKAVHVATLMTTASVTTNVFGYAISDLKHLLSECGSSAVS
jgi:hypothetical protein